MIGGMSTFIGFENYIRALNDWHFWNSMEIVGVFSLSCISVEMLFGFLLALLFFNRNIMGGKIIRSMILLPMMIPPVIVGVTWKLIFSPEVGLATYISEKLLGFSISWLGDPPTALLSIIIVDIWQWTPFVFLLLFAGLNALPQEPFEAARIDGASEWQIIRFLTLPMLKNMMIITMLFRIMDILKEFDKIFVMTHGGPALATDVYSMFVYRTGFKHLQIGYASALSWIYLIITLVFSWFFIRFARKGEIT
jgi:multiple sugar transport system permease protein